MRKLGGEMRSKLFVMLFVVAMLVTACGQSAPAAQPEPAAAAGASGKLTAAGSSALLPLMQLAATKYQQATRMCRSVSPPAAPARPLAGLQGPDRHRQQRCQAVRQGEDRSQLRRCRRDRHRNSGLWPGCQQAGPRQSDQPDEGPTGGHFLRQDHQLERTRRRRPGHRADQPGEGLGHPRQHGQVPLRRE